LHQIQVFLHQIQDRTDLFFLLWDAQRRTSSRYLLASFLRAYVCILFSYTAFAPRCSQLHRRLAPRRHAPPLLLPHPHHRQLTFR
jgi:hypothetical protein